MTNNFLIRNPAADPKDPGPCVVCDVDGVIADGKHREHLIGGKGSPDWEKFFDLAGGDDPIPAALSLLRSLPEDLQVVLLTSRPHRLAEITESWLTKHEVRWDLLIMRPTETQIRGADFKRDMCNQLKKAGYEIRVSIDDDPRVNVEVGKLGIPVWSVDSGIYKGRE